MPTLFLIYVCMLIYISYIGNWTLMYAYMYVK